MEKWIRRPAGLTALFWRYLITTGVVVILLAVLWWFGMTTMMRYGIVYPANTAASGVEAVAQARRAGIAQAVLTGNRENIREILQSLGENPADYALAEADSDAQCAALAVAEVREGRANFLMKGLLGTGDLMRAVIDRDTGLRTGRLISHVMLYEAPGHKMLALTDGGMNTFPDLPKKVEILENAARVPKASMSPGPSPYRPGARACPGSICSDW